MRLQKFLARAGVASRRKCDEEIIPSGRVSVNGDVVTSPGVQVDPNIDDVRLDGKPIYLPAQDVTLMLNKPKGYETTMASDHGSKIVAELVPLEKYPSLVPIGRLDKDTTGLLLFTTDGELCNGLIHPSRMVDKAYRAKVRGRLDRADIGKLEGGVIIDGRITAPCKCKICSYDKANDLTVAEVVIHEGRNRQVRKMFSSIGHEVVSLHRYRFGPLELEGLKTGDIRILSDDEVNLLRSSAARLSR